MVRQSDWYKPEVIKRIRIKIIILIWLIIACIFYLNLEGIKILFTTIVNQL